MKTIHWILLAGLGYYLYSQKSKTATAMLTTQPAPGTWVFDQKTGLISVQGNNPGTHLVPGPDGNLIEVKNPQGSKSDEVYSMAPMFTASGNLPI